MRKLPHHLIPNPAPVAVLIAATDHYPKESTMIHASSTDYNDNPPATLYMVEQTHYPAASMTLTYDDDSGESVYVMNPDWKPAGWDEHCIATWGELRSFFWPSVSKVYRSRSSARAKLDIIECWGGAGRIIIGSATWNTEEDLKRAKAVMRKQDRINKLKAKIAAIEAGSLG